MNRKCLRCGHTTTEALPRLGVMPAYRKRGFATVEEQMEPLRLVDLVTRRPDLADVALLGARLAAGTTEGA